SVARDPAELLARARALPGLVGRDLVAEVTVAEPYGWSEGGFKLGHGYVAPPPPRFRVVAYDCGIKHKILRQLRMAGAHVTVVPAATPAEAVLETKPDGVFLSNGPGDPEAVPYLIESVRGHGLRVARPVREVDAVGLPGGRALPDRVGPRSPRPAAGLRDLSGPPDHGARQRRQHLQAQVRPPRREPSREGPRDGQGRDHRAESRVRGRARVGRPPRVGADAREPQRRHVRGARP